MNAIETVFEMYSEPLGEPAEALRLCIRDELASDLPAPIDWRVVGEQLAGIDAMLNSTQTVHQQAVFYYMGVALVDQAKADDYQNVVQLYMGLHTGPIYNIAPLFEAFEAFIEICNDDIENMLCHSLHSRYWDIAEPLLKTLAVRHPRACLKDAIYFVTEHRAGQVPMSTLALLYVCMTQDGINQNRVDAIESRRFFDDIKAEVDRLDIEAELGTEVYAAKRRLGLD